MREYEVTITETLEMTVAVEAESREEAQQIARQLEERRLYLGRRSLQRRNIPRQRSEP